MKEFDLVRTTKDLKEYDDILLEGTLATIVDVVANGWGYLIEVDSGKNRVWCAYPDEIELEEPTK